MNQSIQIEKPSSFFPVTKNVGDNLYEITLAKTDAELEKVFAFRYQIFHKELGYESDALHEQAVKDHDVYDPYCDHLILRNCTSNEIIGTYRFLQLKRLPKATPMYSETEFNLSKLHTAKLNLVEIGRAAIHKDYRDGLAIQLLWIGLAKYIEQEDVEYYCGLTSLPQGTTVEVARDIYQYCIEKNLILPEELRVTPNPENKIAGLDLQNNAINTAQVKRQLPPLLRAYFSVGCYVGGEPALDVVFDVIDFFTLMDRDKLMSKVARFFR